MSLVVLSPTSLVHRHLAFCEGQTSNMRAEQPPASSTASKQPL